jgi:GNAT superfamily N-acetyltransferase
VAITIRPAAPADVPQILRFVRELAEYEREPDAVKATEPMLLEALFGDRPAAEAVIAELAGVAVGFALFFHNFSTWTGQRSLYLEDLYVASTARRRGAGKALLSHLATLALERGCTRFEWSVLDWNEPSIGFYKSLGAQAMDEWTIMRVDGTALHALAGFTAA